MKKIMAILLSLLFIASTFCFASAYSESDSTAIDCCDPDNLDFSRTLVRVGDTFTISYSAMFPGPCGSPFEEEGLVELIHVNIYDENGALIYSFDPRTIPPGEAIQVLPEWWEEKTYRAVRPGTAVFLIDCTLICDTILGCEGPGCAICSYEDCQCYKTVTIKSRALPMDWIMKHFGLGKFKE